MTSPSRISHQTLLLTCALLILSGVVGFGLHAVQGDEAQRAAIELVTGPDPLSTDELARTGGGIVRQDDLETVAAGTSLMVELRVVEVFPARLNTPDGTLRTAALPGSELLEAQQADQSRPPRQPIPLTDIQVEILDVVGTTGEIGVARGETMTITVVGGSVTHVINDTTLAAEMGLVEVVHNDDPDYHPDPVDGEPVLPPDGLEVEQTPTGPIPLTIELVPSDVLTEGETVIIMLTSRDIELVDGSLEPAITPTHPYGILRAADGGSWQNDTGWTFTREELASVAVDLRGGR